MSKSSVYVFVRPQHAYYALYEIANETNLKPFNVKFYDGLVNPQLAEEGYKLAEFTLVGYDDNEVSDRSVGRLEGIIEGRLGRNFLPFNVEYMSYEARRELERNKVTPSQDEEADPRDEVDNKIPAPESLWVEEGADPCGCCGVGQDDGYRVEPQEWDDVEDTCDCEDPSQCHYLDVEELQLDEEDIREIFTAIGEIDDLTPEQMDNIHRELFLLFFGDIMAPHKKEVQQ